MIEKYYTYKRECKEGAELFSIKAYNREESRRKLIEFKSETDWEFVDWDYKS